MSSIIFFLIFIPILSVILLSVNFIFAPHNPYKEKKTPFECGYHSFLSQNRTQFTISFFIFALLFLIFDLEIVLIYPYTVSSYANNIYGLVIMIIFTLVVTVGFIFELGKNALKIESKQNQYIDSKSNKNKKSNTMINKITSLKSLESGLISFKCSVKFFICLIFSLSISLIILGSVYIGLLGLLVCLALLLRNRITFNVYNSWKIILVIMLIGIQYRILVSFLSNELEIRSIFVLTCLILVVLLHMVGTFLKGNNFQFSFINYILSWSLIILIFVCIKLDLISLGFGELTVWLVALSPITIGQQLAECLALEQFTKAKLTATMGPSSTNNANIYITRIREFIISSFNMDNEESGYSQQAEASSSTAPGTESLRDRLYRYIFKSYFKPGVFIHVVNPITDKSYSVWNDMAEYYYQAASITMAKALFEYWDHLSKLPDGETIMPHIIDGAFKRYISDLVRDSDNPKLASKVGVTGSLTNVLNSVRLRNLIWYKAVAITEEMVQLNNKSLVPYYNDPQFVKVRWLQLTYFHLLEHDLQGRLVKVLQNPIPSKLVKNLEGLPKRDPTNSRTVRYIIKKECEKLAKKINWG